MGDIIQISDHITGARYFKPRTTGLRRSLRDNATDVTAKGKDCGLRLQAPARIRPGDTVSTADGRKGFVLREKPDGKLIVTVNGESRTVSPAALQKAGA